MRWLEEAKTWAVLVGAMLGGGGVVGIIYAVSHALKTRRETKRQDGNNLFELTERFTSTLVKDITELRGELLQTHRDNQAIRDRNALLAAEVKIAKADRENLRREVASLREAVRRGGGDAA